MKVDKDWAEEKAEEIIIALNLDGFSERQSIVEILTAENAEGDGFANLRQMQDLIESAEKAQAAKGEKIDSYAPFLKRLEQGDNPKKDQNASNPRHP